MAKATAQVAVATAAGLHRRRRQQDKWLWHQQVACTGGRGNSGRTSAMMPTHVTASRQALRLLCSLLLPLAVTAAAISRSMSGRLGARRRCSSRHDVGPASGEIIWPNAWNAMPPACDLFASTARRCDVHGSRYERTNFSGANSDILGMRSMTCCFTFVCLESRKASTVSTVCLYLLNKATSLTTV